MRVRSGQETIPNGQECLRGHYKGLGVVDMPFEWAGSGPQALPEGREWSRGPPGWLGVVGRLSRRA